MTISDLVARIDQRLAELEVERADLTSARAALVDGATRPAPADQRRAPAQPRRTPTKPRRPRRGARAATKRAVEVVPAGKLIALLGDSKGMSTRELSRTTNGDPGQVLALLKEQEAAGQVRRSGERAATRWHLITDEDRIAARAAELEASSRRATARRS
jgi:hypothetical protein